MRLCRLRCLVKNGSFVLLLIFSVVRFRFTTFSLFFFLSHKITHTHTNTAKTDNKIKLANKYRGDDMKKFRRPLQKYFFTILRINTCKKNSACRFPSSNRTRIARYDFSWNRSYKFTNEKSLNNLCKYDKCFPKTFQIETMWVQKHNLLHKKYVTADF